MSTIITRLGKGSPLTNIELDSNFTNLNTDKLEKSAFATTANTWLNTKSIDDLGDVVITNPINGQALVWNALNNRWENQTVSGGSGLEGGSLEIVTASTQSFDIFDKTLYTSVKYLIQATCGTEIHTTELTLLQNNTDVFLTEYGTLHTTPLFTLDASIVGNNIDVKVTTLNNNTYIDYKRITLISRIVSTPGWPQDLMLLSGIEDLQTGSGLVDLQV